MDKTAVKILEENHYYPFGLRHTNYNNMLKAFGKDNPGEVTLKAAAAPGEPGTAPTALYRYKYNGKEIQEELGLNVYDYGFRNYMPDLGRWMTQDPLISDLDFKFDPNDIDKEDDNDVAFAIKTTLGNGGGIFNVDNLNPYSYGYNDPIRFDDPDGRCPACVVAAVFAFFYSDLAYAPSKDQKADTQRSNEARANRNSQLLDIMPGGGQTAKGVSVVLNVAKREAAKKIQQTVTKAAAKAGQARNPNGAKGKPDHQNKVKELADKAKFENPGQNIVTEKKIQVEGSNRRPDVQAVDPTTGKTTKIYEAERNPNSTRNKNREAEYSRLGVPHETHKVGGS